MRIIACPKCGSRRIFQGRMKEGVLTGYTSREVCRDCGYRGSPIIFDSEKEYKKFVRSLKNESKKSSVEGFDDKKDSLSDKDKETVDFLKEIDEEIKHDEHKKYSEGEEKKIFKNPAASLGFGLFIVGILVTFFNFYFTIVLIVSGLVLFFIGLLGPSEKSLKESKYIERIKKLPEIAGVFLIVNAIVNFLLYFVMLFFVLRFDSLFDVYNSDSFSNLAFLAGQNQTFFVVFLLVEIVFCVILFVGGVFSFFKKRWSVAVLGSVFGLFLIPIYYVPVIFSFIGMVLISFSRFAFKK